MPNIMYNLKKNDIVELLIEDINNLGAGVSHLEDGRVVFVRGAVTGDKIKAKIIKVNTNFAVARLEEIISASDFRENECFCTASESCGGCVYRHITYDHEKEIKKNYVKHAFIKVGLPDVVINDVHTTNKTKAYRNKAQYPFAMTKNGIVAGFYASKTHNVVPAFDCALQPKIFGEILRDVCDFANENKLTVYNEETGKGLLRHLYMRIGEQTCQIMLCVVINGEKMPCESKFVELFTEKYNCISSIQVNTNVKNTNVVLGEKYRVIHGERYIEDILCGVRFRITPESFYQVNHDGAEILYGLAKEKAINGHDNKISLVDMYCGTGTIGLSMADVASEIVGVEIVEGAVECAKVNAKINGFENAKFYAGDAKDIESLFASVEAQHGALNPDVVVLDPPRKGCTPEVIEFLSNRNINHIVYVSCDADTLARDCKMFSNLGYTIGAVDPVDMFPRTGHIENVVLLTRKLIIHNMNLDYLPFEMIKSGQKTIELRLNDEKRQLIKIGDKIVFTNTNTKEKLTVTVIKLHKFETFNELYDSLPLLKCGYTDSDISTAHPSDMEVYYPKEKQMQHGVLGIEIECERK